MKFDPRSGEKIITTFHPATSMYLSNGCCQHWPSHAMAYVDRDDPNGFVTVVQQSEETDADTVARAKGMFLRGVRGMYGFAQ